MHLFPVCCHFFVLPNRNFRFESLSSQSVELWLKSGQNDLTDRAFALRAVKLGMIRKVAKNLSCYSTDLLLLRILFDIGPPPTTPDNRFSTRIYDVYHQGSNFGLTVRCRG